MPGVTITKWIFLWCLSINLWQSLPFVAAMIAGFSAKKLNEEHCLPHQ
jgi:hypothetical protein